MRRSQLVGLVVGVLVAMASFRIEAQIPVWGDVVLKGYPVGERVAPNGGTYDPLFSLGVDLNLGSREFLYVFLESIFWGQKAASGVTNKEYGAVDFSKREFDLNLGAAWRPLQDLEARVFFYSQSNLNRGTDLKKPSGYLDGGGLEGRYYWGPDTYVGAGYYLSKRLIGQDGQRFPPAVFLDGAWSYEFWRMPEQAHLFVKGSFITKDPATPKLLGGEVGVGIRPFRQFLNLEFRLGVEGVYDVDVHRGRLLPTLGTVITF